MGKSSVDWDLMLEHNSPAPRRTLGSFSEVGKAELSPWTERGGETGGQKRNALAILSSELHSVTRQGQSSLL